MNNAIQWKKLLKRYVSYFFINKLIISFYLSKLYLIFDFIYQKDENRNGKTYKNTPEEPK